MLLEKLEQIRAAKACLPSPTMVAAAELITDFVADNPNNWPEDAEEAGAIYVNAVILAKTKRLGRDLAGSEIEALLEEAKPYAGQIMSIGLSGALWRLRTAGRLKTGAKWMGRAALFGLAATLGFGIG